MSATTLVRAGVGGLLAAALFVTATVLHQVDPVQSAYASISDYVHQVLLVLAFLGAAGAIIGIAAAVRTTGRMRTLAVVGAVLAAGGYAVVGLLSLVDLVEGERTLVTARVAAAGLLTIGSVLLGVLVLITRALPWWCGVLLIVAFPVGDVVNAVFAGGEGLLLALLWGSVGVALLRRAGAATRPTGMTGARRTRAAFLNPPASEE